MQKLLPFGSDVVAIFSYVDSLGDRMTIVTIPFFNKTFGNIALNIALCAPQRNATKLGDLSIRELHLAS